MGGRGDPGHKICWAQKVHWFAPKRASEQGLVKGTNLARLGLGGLGSLLPKLDTTQPESLTRLSTPWHLSNPLRATGHQPKGIAMPASR